MWKLRVILAAILFPVVLALNPFQASAQEVVDLELVLAVDASASVSNDEFRLQMDGIAAAFRDGAVQQAIRSGPLQRIGVALVIWADADGTKPMTDWFTISGSDEAAAFAQTVEQFPREIYGGTGIGAGILHAIERMRNNHLTAARRVVDVSGDGMESDTNNFTQMVDFARRAATEERITVNGLAILTDEPNLDTWYMENVATGLGRFVMAANTFEDFAIAMKKKLIQEIEYTPPVVLAD
ncbi:MAG: DUF1194 domain-containing protein [Alphaproteobacteria bacterium]